MSSSSLRFESISLNPNEKKAVCSLLFDLSSFCLKAWICVITEMKSMRQQSTLYVTAVHQKVLSVTEVDVKSDASFLFLYFRKKIDM